MPDQIVSVRMPVTLINELKELAEKNHFLDISEEVRSLLREKWQEHSDPYSIKLMAIKETAAKAALNLSLSAGNTFFIFSKELLNSK